MQWGFKSSDMPGRGSHDQDICDSVVMRVMFLWFSQTNVPQGCFGPHRDTTSFISVWGPKSSEETRKCCKCRNRSFSLFYCIHLFHYFCCVSLFCQVHLQGEKKYYHDQMMVINIWFLLKGAKSKFAILEMFRLNLSTSSLIIRVNLLHPWPSQFLYSLSLSLWCFSILVSYYLQFFFH